MYARTINNTVYDFGVSGKLIMNALVMYDRQTDTYWSQILGEAVKGPLAGEKLQFVQSWFTTWGEWKARHPDTVALDKGGAYGDTYSSYYTSDRAGIRGETVDDDRLPTKAFVIGVAEEDAAVAYPFEALRRQPVVNDTVGQRPVVVVFLPQSETALVYDRRVDGQPLRFEWDPPTGQLIDRETGTRWDTWRGLAVEGELEGSLLRRVPSTRAFWFGWKDWYPDTAVGWPD